MVAVVGGSGSVGGDVGGCGGGSGSVEGDVGGCGGGSGSVGGDVVIVDKYHVKVCSCLTL